MRTDVFSDGCHHDDAEPSKIQIANGTWKWGYYCWDCAQWVIKRQGQTGVWLPNRLADLDVLPVVDYPEPRECEHCHELEFCEEHHYGPKGLFGKDDAENWPTGWLCVGCHGYWHAKMGHPIRRKKPQTNALPYAT